MRKIIRQERAEPEGAKVHTSEHRSAPSSLVWIAAALAVCPPLLFFGLMGHLRSVFFSTVAAAFAIGLALSGWILLSPIWYHGGPGAPVYVAVLTLVNFCAYYVALRAIHWWNTQHPGFHP